MSKSHSGELEGKMHLSNSTRQPVNGTVYTIPYFSPAYLAGFDARCDRGLEQMLYLHALIEEDNVPIGAEARAAAAD